jgi:putative ABC transport system substrate-binding protein
MRWIGLAVVLAASLALTPVDGGAQQRAGMPRVGVLRLDSPQGTDRSIAEFSQGLRELGYFDGQNIALEIRWAEHSLERLPALAADLVRLKVDVIVTHAPAGIRAARGASGTIPIVMGRMGDADGYGFVKSLARPGGRITGLSFQTDELSSRWLGLLKESLPNATRVAVLWEATSPDKQLKAIETFARSIGVQLQVLTVRGPGDFDTAFGAAKAARAEGLVVLGSVLHTLHRQRLAELATANRFPAIYYHRGFAEAGGMLAYGPKESDPSWGWRRAAVFVDKILKGAKPADLPVEQPTVFELLINLKTAKALGVNIPQSILIRADQVIE